MTIQLIIQGKVQGVFYRACARDKAQSLGVRGWVRNTAEGHVEIMASGKREDLDRFVEWCRKGPPKAVVTEVNVQEIEDRILEGFMILR